MTKFHTYLMTGAVFAFVTGLNQTVQARECLIDTNDNGTATVNLDTVDGATSGGATTLACGQNADASGSNSTSVGRDSEASGASSSAFGVFAGARGANAVAIGYFANVPPGSANSVAVGFLATTIGDNATAVGNQAQADGDESTALGRDSRAPMIGSTALGYMANAGGSQSTAVGSTAIANASNGTALGYGAVANGNFSTAMGTYSSTTGTSSIAIGSGNGVLGANASGSNSIVIGFGASDGANADAIVIGKDAIATEPGQIILGAANTFSIDGTGKLGLGTDNPAQELHIAAANPGMRFEANGGLPYEWAVYANSAGFSLVDITGGGTTPFSIADGADNSTLYAAAGGRVGMGTQSPLANLDINSGAVDTTLLLNNTGAQWEMKSKASTGRLVYKNLTAGGVPFKLGPTAVNGLLSIGTAATDLVEVRGDLDVTGTLTTGGPTCGGGCDAVFDADYDLPSIEDHAKAMYANGYLPAVGPTIPKAPVNLAEMFGNMLNELEKTHIYIDQLNGEKQSMQTKLDQQARDIAKIEQQLAQLTAK